MSDLSLEKSRLPNGSAAAAILAAAFGCFILGIFSLTADFSKSFANFLVFYEPTGPLSGVTCSSILIWLLSWLILSSLWSGKTVAMLKVNALAFALLAFGLLLTFPPFMDVLQGK